MCTIVINTSLQVSWHYSFEITGNHSLAMCISLYYNQNGNGIGTVLRNDGFRFSEAAPAFPLWFHDALFEAILVNFSHVPAPWRQQTGSGVDVHGNTARLVRTLTDIEISAKSRWHPLTGSSSKITCVSACRHNSKTILTAICLCQELASQ